MAVIKTNKLLGFGTMRMPMFDDETVKRAKAESKDPLVRSGVDVEQVKKMVDMFIENGFTYFDTAWMYHNFKSHNVVKAALTDRYPHEAYTLADKMNTLYFKEDVTLDDIFEASLERCGVEYFDYYLLHDMGHDNYKTFEEAGAFEWIVQKKEEGLIKHIGFSCHDDKLFLEKALTEHPEFEFVQLQINYLDWDSAGIDAHGSYDTVTSFGKDVIVMEPVKGGVLANVPDSVKDMFEQANPGMSPASWAIRFAASLENVKMVLSGMSNLEQMADNIDFMKNFKPLTEDEIVLVAKAAEEINSDIVIACTACNYCVPGCPSNIAIPRYFSLYNTDMKETRTDWTPQREYYERLTHNFGKASDCIECGQCESICPQHLTIIDYLKDVADRFEKS